MRLTSDGFRPYLDAVDAAFVGEIDLALLVKWYDGEQTNERRYGPAECVAAIKKVFGGSPDRDHISTSFVERQNWTLRGTMRRYTRLSNGFSRKIEKLLIEWESKKAA